jgi:murein DD-endopeptidase MepM/ murein hydrolase activator NlpD
MESKHRKLPKSRKAMEYRVYWLERKLKHLKVSEHRKEHGIKIASMPEGPVKDLMHLNNEFNQAVEQAAGLRDITEELNRDTITLNERTERLHEVAAEKLATMDRNNRQSARIQERGREINKESLKTAAISRAVTKSSQDHVDQMQRQIDEAAYLADLTRAQHAATDKLNQTTRNLNEEAVKTTASSLKINRHLADTTGTARELNEKSAAIQAELTELRAELRRQDDITRTLNRRTEQKLEVLNRTQLDCEAVADKTEQFLAEGEQQIAVTGRVTEEAQQATEASRVATEASQQQQTELFNAYQQSEQELGILGRALEQQIDEALTTQQDEIDGFKAATVNDLNQHQEALDAELNANIDQHLTQASETIEQQLDATSRQLTTHIEQVDADLESLKSDTNQTLECNIEKFNQDARLRFMAVEERSKRLTSEFADEAQHQLSEFSQESGTRLGQADQLLKTLSVDVAVNLEQSSACRRDTEALLSTTETFNADTERLNNETRALLERSTAAVSKVDSALEEVNSISRKMFRETRELQDRTETLHDNAEQTAANLTELNEKSLQIQSDSIQTQSLSQEINRHSLDLNEETQRLQDEFNQTHQANQALTAGLKAIKADLESLGEKTAAQLARSETSTAAVDEARVDFEQLKDKTEQLNGRIEGTLNRASSLLNEVERQSLNSVELFNRAENLTEDLERTKQAMAEKIAAASQVTTQANDAIHDIQTTQADLERATEATCQLNEATQEQLEAVASSHAETNSLNAETREMQADMRQSVAQARQINDDFMRGLESLSRKNEATETQSQQLLAETQAIQLEMNNILELKHGIDGFQQAVDDGRAELNGLISKVDQCQAQSSSHERLVAQYQQRMEAYQSDVTRYRESMLQLEKKFRSIDAQFQAQEVRLEDNEHLMTANLQAQKSQLEEVFSELQQNLQNQQEALDHTKQALKDDSEKLIERIRTELEEDIEQKLDEVSRATSSQLNQTDGELRLLNSEVQQLNRSLLDEINALKNETAAVNQQHQQLQKEQVQQINEQRDRTQQQEFELDTVKHQLENYQRLIETQLDNAPHDQLQQRIKQLESTLRQQQRSLKAQEAENKEPKNDARVTELQQMVERLNRSMNEIAHSNEDLKNALDETRNANQSLSKTNRELELSLAASQTELDRCLQRLHRLESREASLEETLSTLKHRDSDTQQTLQQMRNAVKDSTKTMRETQRTLENLNSNGKKRDWLSPKQAVMSSVFAAAITGMSFFGYEEVNAAYSTPDAEEVTHVTSIQHHQPPAAFEGNRSGKLLSRTLEDLRLANQSIVELGEFAWPVNFGIVDPNQIEYREQHQGISIEAELGDPVVAINDGTVVYSGNEIRGYGNMIVIQHDQELLSVYANNQYNYVNEGDQVRRGQLIGDIGQLFNEDTAGLYFEIRHGGEPTDPFNYLRNHAASGSSNLDMLSAR